MIGQYYAIVKNNQRELQHHKYIDKYKNKAGKWVYVYTKVASDYARATSGVEEKRAELEAKQHLVDVEKKMNEAIAAKDKAYQDYSKVAQSSNSLDDSKVQKYKQIYDDKVEESSKATDIWIDARRKATNAGEAYVKSQTLSGKLEAISEVNDEYISKTKNWLKKVLKNRR